MSLSATLSSALSGLTAASRAAEIVSSNVANARTEGYGRRELELAARRLGTDGHGVEVIGTTRNVNQILLSDRRVADAGAADRDVRQAFLARLEEVLGNSDSEASLSGRAARLSSSLIEAASRPESQARLSAVLDAARGLAGSVASAATDVQTARTTADKRIATEVAEVNTALKQIAEMNIQIRAISGTGQDASALMDQRQQLTDRIAGIVPLREVAREHGQIALFTTGGAMLLEGSRPAELGFTPVGLITADMTLTGGALSGLMLNGRPVPIGASGSLMAGGSLAANFAIRDDLGVSAQTQLDALARDLTERFQNPLLDPTLAPGDAGLFTDNGAAFAPANEVGLAQRLRVNAVADPAAGGAVWRLRDGMGSTAPGISGNSALLSALQTALSAPRTPVSGGFLPGARSFAAMTTDIVSGIAGQRLAADADVSFSTARADALRQMELEQGVDTDQEMQNLLQIERVYAANARVIQTVDDMIQILIGI
jgi:flagellar hook-associated protein 1